MGASSLASYPNREATGAADAARYLTLEEFASIAASYWSSVAEAAWRGERIAVQVHCKQIAAVTREAFGVARALGEPFDREDAA